MFVNNYSYYTLDGALEYFVYRSPQNDRYYIMDSGGESEQTEGRGYRTAEAAQVALDKIAKDMHWLRGEEVPEEWLTRGKSRS